MEDNPNDIKANPGSLKKALMLLRADFDAHNHDGVNSKSFLTLIAETVSARVMQIRKTSFTDDTSGLWVGLVGDTLKMYLGTATAYLKWTGTALQIAGDIVAGSLTIGSNASIDSSGNATFISMSSLNMKAYTDFETAGRFISTVGGSGSNSFGNQGVTVAPGTSSTSYSRLLWWITQYVFNNNPTFTCSMLALSGFASGTGHAFIGLGAPTISGASIAVTGTSHAGFRFMKTAGVTTFEATQCDGSASRSNASITTVTNSDSLELFIKFTGTSVKYYYRKNGGTLTLGATLTTFIPTAAETYIFFGVTNDSGTDEFQLQLQCAAYEH